MGYVIDFDLSIILIAIVIWLCIIVFIRLKKRKSVVFLLFFSVFYAYIIKVLDVTQFPIFLNQDIRVIHGQTIWKTMNLTPLATLTKKDFQTLFLNIILTIPFGFGLPFISKSTWRKIFVVGIIFGTILESLQLVIGLIAGFTFRIVDINDVLSNAFGVIVGYALFVAFMCGFRFFLKERPENPILRYIYERNAK